MKTVLSMVLGGTLGFLATATAIGATVLLGTGIAGGILVRERPGIARVMNYDPSDTILRAGLTGGTSLLLIGLFAAIYVRLKRTERAPQPGPIES